MSSFLSRGFTAAKGLMKPGNINLNIRPLHPNPNLQSIIPETVAKEFSIVVISYDARLRRLTVATDERYRTAVETRIREYAEDSAFRDKLGNPRPEQISVVVEVFNPEQVQAALIRLYQSKQNVERIPITVKIARCVDIEVATQFRVLVTSIRGTEVSCIAEDGPGRETLTRMFDSQSFRERISESAFGESRLWNQLSPSIKFVDPGTVHKYIGEIYEVDQKASQKKIDDIAERINAGTAVKEGVIQRTIGEPEQLLSEIIGKLAEEKFSDVLIRYDFDTGEMLVRARVNGEYRDVQRLRMLNEAYKRIMVWIVTTTSGEPLIHKEHNGPLTFKKVVLPKSRRTVELATRVSYIPLTNTLHRNAECNGRVSFRILSGASNLLRLNELGYNDREYAVMLEVNNHRHGVVILVGEMGSGKSGTASALLTEQSILNPGKDIISIEQPVEYHNPYISQCELAEQENPMSKLKTVVRQGINGLFMGEINTKEMGEMAITSGMGGVFVVTTFHSTDPFTAVQRITEEPYEIVPSALSSCILAIIYQSLANKLCPTCSTHDFDWKDRLGANAKYTVNMQHLLEMLKKLKIPTTWEEAFEIACLKIGEDRWEKLSDKQKDSHRQGWDKEADGNIALAIHLSKVQLGKETLDLERWREECLEKQVLPFFVPLMAKGKTESGENCPDCVGKGKEPGIGGRTAIPEIWKPTKSEKRLIDNHASAVVLREAALKNGHCTLHRAGIDRLIRGVIGIEEYFDALGALVLEDQFPDEEASPDLDEKFHQTETNTDETGPLRTPRRGEYGASGRRTSGRSEWENGPIIDVPREG